VMLPVIAVPTRAAFSATANVAPSSMAIRSAVQTATAHHEARTVRRPRVVGARRRKPRMVSAFIPASMHAEGTAHG
jgi:hypothetical protein